MIVCICKQVTGSELRQIIKDAPIVKMDPFSKGFKSEVDQIVEYFYASKQNENPCQSCRVFVSLVVTDILDSGSL